MALDSPLAVLADHLLGDGLEASLRRWRESEGLSWDDVSKRLWAETDHKVSISGPGVIEWAKQLGIPTGRPTKPVS